MNSAAFFTMMIRNSTVPAVICLLSSGAMAGGGCAIHSDDPAATAQPVQQDAAEWTRAEVETLTSHVQLTFPDRFTKAGEAYFSPDMSMVIFQAVEQPAEGEEAEPHYQMFVADFVRDEDDNDRIIGIENVRRLTPEGSANTCGWFHPTREKTVIFGSSTVPPADEGSEAGYQRDNRRYEWLFPPEMDVVQVDLTQADGTADSWTTLAADPEAYLAECSLTTDGRHLLYCSYVTKKAPHGGDLLVKDLQTGKVTELVTVPGYDGGPFFSPDERWICYRSDRRGDNHLQVFIAELEYDDNGAITGVSREIQVTDNEHVNWAPFWDPTGRYLVYTTSEQGHWNYEVYRVDTKPGPGVQDLETTRQRITYADGFDGLPVYSPDGRYMMWTSQRDGSNTSQLWLAEIIVQEKEHEIDAPELPAKP